MDVIDIVHTSRARCISTVFSAVVTACQAMPDSSLLGFDHSVILWIFCKCIKPLFIVSRFPAWDGKSVQYLNSQFIRRKAEENEESLIDESRVSAIEHVLFCVTDLECSRLQGLCISTGMIVSIWLCISTGMIVSSQGRLNYMLCYLSLSWLGSLYPHNCFNILMFLCLICMYVRLLFGLC